MRDAGTSESPSTACDAAYRNSDIASAVAEARARYVAARPKSAALHAKARAVMPGGNTRSVLAYDPFPTAMAGGEGCTLWDIDGHRYLDLCGEYTAGLFGHSEPAIRAAVTAALENGLNLAAVGEAEVRLAELICGRFPSIERIRFTNSGTEGNLMAISAARAFTGRERIMVFKGGYHGGVLSFPLAGPTKVAAPFPLVLSTYNDLDEARAQGRRHAADLAAILVEPMLGSGGCIPAHPAFLTGLRELADETGAVLILDEVMTSRMSAAGMQGRLRLAPDMTTLGKYMAGGMSFGAFGGKAAIMDQFAAKLAHAGTFNNNVLSMAAGSVALGRLFQAETAERLFARGQAMRDALNAACAQADVPMRFTGLGSLAAPHFRPGPIVRPYAPEPAEEALRELFFFDMLEAGIYLARRGMVALSLPVAAADIGRFTDAVAEFALARGPLLRQIG